MNATNNLTSSTNERILNLIIVDESASMTSIYNEELNGMNETIHTIKSKADEVSGIKQYVNLITFDTTHYKQHLRHCPAENVRFLTSDDYRPCGGTPLYDAIGHAVTSLERHTTANDAVLVTIITDGYENASREFTANEIRRLVQRLSAKGWLFTFIGANQDVMFEAGKMGIRNAMSFASDSDGTKEMWEKEKLSRNAFYNRINNAKLTNPHRSMRNLMDEESANDNFFGN